MPLFGKKAEETKEKIAKEATEVKEKLTKEAAEAKAAHEAKAAEIDEEILKNAKPDDNPILVLFKFKEF